MDRPPTQIGHGVANSSSTETPSQPSQCDVTNAVASSMSSGAPRVAPSSRPSVDAVLAQPVPQYAQYRPRSSTVPRPEPPRSAPPIPRADGTDTTLLMRANATQELKSVPLSPIQNSLASSTESKSSSSMSEAQTQAQGQYPDSGGKAKEEGEDEDDAGSNAAALPHTRSAAANPIEALQASNPEELTPLRAHYLKKTLIQLQYERELTAVTTLNPHWPNVSTLSYLGPPFLPPPKDAPAIDLPFMQYIFRQFVLTFPFMASAPKDFYSQKLQPFVASLISRNMSSSSVLDDEEDGGEQATRKKLLMKIERNLSLFLGAATRLTEKEEVVRLTQADLDRLEYLTKRRQEKLKKRNRDHFEVNIVGVRTVVDKGRVRTRAHEEFVIRTRRSRYEDVFVSRRYGDFRTLATELAKAHPEEQIRPPPQKDRTYVTVSSLPSAAPASQPPFQNGDYSNAPYDLQPSPPEVMSRLIREKNRLTLRSYLHSLISSPTVASSPVFKSFLLSEPIRLTPEEREDARRREEADRVREDGRKKFAKEIASRVDGLRDAVKSVKGDVMGKDGLMHIFGIIKVTPDIRGLPSNYQAVTEWARISLASTVFHQFVASDNASQTFAGLKRIHGLMPYFMLKAALKISNPIGMIRSILDLFLAQPFGGKSLLQRMFTSSLAEEVKRLQEEIEAVRDKVDDPVMCEKVRQFVYAPREIQEMFRADATSEKMNIFVVVLRSAEEPLLSRPQMHRLARAHRAHVQYEKFRGTLGDSDDDDGPQDEDAWLLEDLKVLAYLYTRLRDREMLIDLIFEGFTAELLKDIITIFYSPLAQVYRAANIADSLTDLQNFINDLIKTVEQVEESIQEDPHHTVQAFIDLIQRHEQSFYSFVHKVHSKGEGLFDNLMRWIEMFLTVVREGLSGSLSLEFLLPHTGKERADILAEVDKIALYHYKLKVMYESKLRRRFGNAQGDSFSNDADAEDEATQALVNGVIGEISFGDLVEGDAIDVAAEETEESSDESGSSEYATDEDTSSEEGSASSTEESRRSSIHASQSQQTRSQHPPYAQYKSPSPPSASAPYQLPPSVQYRSRFPAASASTASVASTPSLPARKRSLSLKRMKSLTFNRSTGSLTSRKSNEIPPVPPLPRTPQTAMPVMSASASSPSKHLSQSRSAGPDPYVERGLLSSPTKHQARTSPLSPVSGQHSKQLPQAPPGASKAGEKKKKKVFVLEAPELQSIPQLLPVFVEMMRPALRVRRVNQK